MKLFGYLPDTLFQPLAGLKRQVYARLLLHLYNRVFAARILETPTKDEVLNHITIVLSEAGVASPDQLAEDGADANDNDQAHSIAYRRLRDTGWLIEEREKWRVMVEMHPDAFMLLGAVADFYNRRLRVAGAVVEVKSNLEAAANDPATMAQGLTNAHDTPLRFARSMRRILVGMHNIEEQILGNPNAGSILRTFFEDLPSRQSMKLDESLLLLVMRLYYEEALKRFEINEAGEVEVESETLLEVYEERTRRERPLIGRAREILAVFRQRGLVRVDEHEDRRSFTLFLRPALPMVVAHDTLVSLENLAAESARKAGVAVAGESGGSE
jgi:hypothetical protein